MAYVIPGFNLECNIYTGPWASKVLRLADQECALAVGRRTAAPTNAGAIGDQVVGVCFLLLLPAGTDVRDAAGYIYDAAHVGTDYVEVPAGSDAWYAVNSVVDVGKGYPNEFREATLGRIGENIDHVEFNGYIFPSPYP